LKYTGTRERADGKTEVLLEVGKPEMRNANGEMRNANGETPPVNPQSAIRNPQSVWSARPLMFPTQQGLMRNPAIRKRITHDLYLEPEEVTEAQSAAALRLAKGETAQLGDYTVHFVRFDVPKHMGSQGDFTVGAVLEVTRAGKTQEVVPTFGYQGKHMVSEPAALGKGVEVRLTGIQADAGMVTLQWKGLPAGSDQPATALVVVTLKPLMSVLWLGCLVLMLGGIVAFHRRVREAAQEEPLPAEAVHATTTWRQRVMVS
jgi:cytochrome c biogenesis factor